MKIRYGFVSNSSTTSFAIIGIERRSDTINVSYNDIYDDENIEFHDDGYYVFAGISIKSMKDDETLFDLKNKALTYLQKYFNDVTLKEIKIHIEAIFN